MALNARKHTVPGGGDQSVNRATIFDAFGNSINDVVPVANATERAQVVADLVAASQGPSSTDPLIIYRGDAPGLSRIEHSADGSVWIPASGVLSFASKTAADSFATANSGLLSAGDECVISGVRYRWSGTLWYIPFKGDRVSTGTNGSGIVQVTHGMGKAPTSVTASIASDSPVIPGYLKCEVGAITATTFDVKIRRSDQDNGVFAGNPVVFYWTAVA